MKRKIGLSGSKFPSIERAPKRMFDIYGKDFPKNKRI